MSLFIVILHNITFDLNFFLTVHAFCFQEIFSHTEVGKFGTVHICSLFLKILILYPVYTGHYTEKNVKILTAPVIKFKFILWFSG